MVRLFYTEVKRTPKDRSSRRLHLAAHEMLRQGVLSCLTGITGKQPHAVRLQLAYGPYGKPFLASHPALNVSLSHAGELALCAVSEEDIGADIQDERKMPDDRILRIAGRFFPEEEKALLEALPADERFRQFFRLWAAKEAYAKLTGRGMREDFTTFFADTEAMCVRRAGTGEAAGSVLAYLKEIDLLPGYRLFLCTENRVADVSCIRMSLDETMTARPLPEKGTPSP